jgi:predicted DNA-binding transcriptional regulator YafY
VCGFGGKVEVMAPAEVRQGMREMVQKLAKMHQ